MELVSDKFKAWPERFQHLLNPFYVLLINICLDVVPIKASPESGIMTRWGYLPISIVL